MNATTLDISVFIPPDVLNLEALMRGELNIAGRQTAQAMGDLVRSNITKPDAHSRRIDSTHALLNSIEADVIEVTDEEIIIAAWSSVAHALWIEEGRPAGYVSPSIIMEWMLDKGIAPRAGETLEQAAAAIAHKITAEGYEARRPFSEALESSPPLLVEAVERAARRLLRRFNVN